MIKHYLKVAFRNLMKYKPQSFVSIIGLAVGFTCFALSVLWIRYEMTYDNFHEGADRIYLAGSSFRLYGLKLIPPTGICKFFISLRNLRISTYKCVNSLLCCSSPRELERFRIRRVE